MFNSKFKLSLLTLPITIIALVIISFYIEPTPERTTYSRLLMGTVVEITVDDHKSEDIDATVEAAFSEIAALEKIFSSYKLESDVSRITLGAGKGPVTVAPEVVTVVEKALEISRASRGAFDPTFGPLTKLWSFNGEVGRVPTVDEVEPLRALVDYRLVIVDAEASTIELKKMGMSINLGGVAKGFIVGRSMELLKKGGVKRAIIKAGGDMFLIRERETRPFYIGVKDPREEGRLVAKLEVKSGAVATSGDYERFFIKDETRYHHILDPSTGFPARRSRSVTILSRDSTLADALSTAVFILGPEYGLKMVEETDGVEAFIVGSTGTVSFSSGLEGRVDMRELINEQD